MQIFVGEYRFPILAFGVASCRTLSGVGRLVFPVDHARDIGPNAVEVRAESDCDGRAGRIFPSISRRESSHVFEPSRLRRRIPNADNGSAIRGVSKNGKKTNRQRISSVPCMALLDQAKTFTVLRWATEVFCHRANQDLREKLLPIHNQVFRD